MAIDKYSRVTIESPHEHRDLKLHTYTFDDKCQPTCVGDMSREAGRFPLSFLAASRNLCS